MDNPQIHLNKSSKTSKSVLTDSNSANHLLDPLVVVYNSAVGVNEPKVQTAVVRRIWSGFVYQWINEWMELMAGWLILLLAPKPQHNLWQIMILWENKNAQPATAQSIAPRKVYSRGGRCIFQPQTHFHFPQVPQTIIVVCVVVVVFSFPCTIV